MPTTSLPLLSFCLLAFIVYSSSYTQPICHERESSALLQFKNSLFTANFSSGSPAAYPKVDSWKLEGRSSDCCSWDGVGCDSVTGHVIGLDLSSSFLYGSINSSSSLFRLVQLRRLNLADNDFNYSIIPSRISHLSRLTSLNLSGSAFYGQVPLEISKLSQLVTLDLSQNVYFPDSSHYMRLLEIEKPSLRSLVQNLTKLKVLNLYRVTIPSLLPNTFANISFLTKLSLKDCGMSGEFPRDVFKLPKLEILSVRYNQQLTGHLPEFNWKSPLKDLRLASTSFSGELPNSIANLDSLNYLDLSWCNFSGPVPSSFGNLTKLAYLDLEHNNFGGDLPPSFGELTQLVHLNLSENNFTGHIPSWFANLTQLVSLRLSNNNFSRDGNLPFLGKLTKLLDLYLGYNNLHGEIPSSIANLTQLHILSILSSQLVGRIPPWLMNMTQLTVLGLKYNMLQGPIPNTISQLVNLEVLDLAAANLSGTVKGEEFLSLKNLTWLQLSYNQLTWLPGSIVNVTLSKLRHLALASCGLTEFPDFLRDQHNLRWLDLSQNRIQGLIPKWIWNMSKETLFSIYLSGNLLTGFEQPPPVLPWSRLRLLDLSSNMLQGSLPVPPSSAFYYNVSNNKLIGEIPPLICHSTSLYSLDLSHNNLSGAITPCLGSFSDTLSLLNLESNNFQGPIPQIGKNGSQLVVINLRQNQLQGPLPSSLANCTLLEVLDLSNNQINDTFPFWLGNLAELKILILRFNRFHGAIQNTKPSSVFPSLRIIDLSHNAFVGKLPSDYFPCWKAMQSVYMNQSGYMQTGTKLSEPDYIWLEEYSYSMTIINKGLEMAYMKIPNILGALDLSSNHFEGEISESIGIFRSLQMLNLSNNNLVGPIPSSFGNLTQLESLDLCRNNLSGRIPQQLAQLTFMSRFNVSHNRLTGPIPQGNQFDTYENSSFDWNWGLCGSTLSKKCGNPKAPPPPPPADSGDDEDSEFPSKIEWVVISLGCASGLVVGWVIGQTLTAWKHQWFVATFGRRQRRWRKRGQRC